MKPSRNYNLYRLLVNFPEVDVQSAPLHFINLALFAVLPIFQELFQLTADDSDHGQSAQTETRSRPGAHSAENG